jgi:hypothetical protein
MGGARRNGVSMRQANEEPDDRGWQDYANCLGVDPDLFFPERGASTREAKGSVEAVSYVRTASNMPS